MARIVKLPLKKKKKRMLSHFDFVFLATNVNITT